MLRSYIIKKGGNHYAWVIDMHHITADGTSQNILEKEFVNTLVMRNYPGGNRGFPEFLKEVNREIQLKTSCSRP